MQRLNGQLTARHWSEEPNCPNILAWKYGLVVTMPPVLLCNDYASVKHPVTDYFSWASKPLMSRSLSHCAEVEGTPA